MGKIDTIIDADWIVFEVTSTWSAAEAFTSEIKLVLPSLTICWI